MRPVRAGECAEGSDAPLLIYVSEMSVELCHEGWPRTAMRRFGLLIAFALILTQPLLPKATQADSRTPDELRQEVERGSIQPLTNILAAVREKLPGEVVKVEVEHRAGIWVYELRLVDPQGRIFKVYVDARTAQIQRVEEK
jgi:peptidase YpeB-like protein